MSGQDAGTALPGTGPGIHLEEIRRTPISNFPAFIADRSKPTHCAVSIEELERLRGIEAAARHLVTTYRDVLTTAQKGAEAWAVLETLLKEE